jgi:hypothetical protein
MKHYRAVVGGVSTSRSERKEEGPTMPRFLIITSADDRANSTI